MPRKRGSARRRRRRGRLGPLLRVLSVVLAAVAIVAALTLFFKVDEVQVTGGGRYTEEEIRSASGVEQGDNLILLDKYRIAQRIYTALPYITEVRINRQLPDVLLVEVVETQAVAAVQGAGAWWLVSPTGKVLEAVDSEAAQDYLILEGMTAQDPAAGEPLAEGDTVTLYLSLGPEIKYATMIPCVILFSEMNSSYAVISNIFPGKHLEQIGSFFSRS